MTHNIESDWASLLNSLPPEAGNNVADQVAAIIQGRINGFYPETLMINLINGNKDGRSHDVIPNLTDDEIDQEFEALLRTIDPQYGDPIANEIAEILEMKLMGINVNALLLNIISKRNIIDISDADE
tara:strand:- start:21 stop:401 length:381 start_codon:yes stop_codon:yes gene_type:complete